MPKISEQRNYHNRLLEDKKIMSMKGKKHSEETRKKMSDRHKGVPHSKEHSENIGKALKGREITWTDKLRDFRIGKKATDETKQKMSKSHVGKNNHQFGKKLSGEHKQKISETRIERGVATGCKNSQYIDGRKSFPYCDKFNERRKRAVRSFFGYFCIGCGKHQDENIIYYKGKGYVYQKLAVHHVDHDKEQGCNGKPFNLIPLCRSCHSKEGNNQEEYRKYVNKTLQEGFKWGIWNEEEYKLKVMYDE
jgi:hypothetical protein